MCTAFSSWQHVNNKVRDPSVVKRERLAAIVHMDFSCRLYAQQIERGCYFLHEHPDGATSWDLPCLRKLVAMQGVKRITGDQCQMGRETEAGEPIRKRTGFVSNSPELLLQLERRCVGTLGNCSRPAGGKHKQCRGKIARRAAIYSDEMCEAVLIGMRRQMRVDGYSKSDEVGANIVMLSGDDEVNAFLTDQQGSTEELPPRAEDDPQPGVLSPDDAHGHPGKSKP